MQQKIDKECTDLHAGDPYRPEVFRPHPERAEDLEAHGRNDSACLGT
ncbi:hypothetical protein Vwe01_44720 [Micromonospora andamanensis]|nr:hypothetical protein Vwe01_44720 [Micromonospora andamanensis]